MIFSQIHINALHAVSRQLSIIFRAFYTSSHANQLFDQYPRRNFLSVHNSMLDSLHKSNPFQALESFKKQIKLGFSDNADEVMIAIALKACRGDSKIGTQIHSFAISSGFIPYVTVSNSLMKMYSMSGEFHKALWIFEGLNRLDIVSWNTVLSGFQNSEDAFRFALRMNKSGIVFDAVTYTTVLSFCSSDNEFCCVLTLHSMVLRCGLDCETYVGNALVTFYARWGRLVDARRVFDEMPNRDLVSWNAILSGYAQVENCSSEATSVFVEMVRKEIKLDRVSFTSAISAFGHERNLKLGRQGHGLAVKTGYDSHLSVCNVLMSTYSKCGVPEYAKLVFKEMDERNVVSWTTMISIDEHDFMYLFNEMRLDGVYPNDVTFVGLLHAITTRNLVEEGRMVHGFCIVSGFVFESNVCNSLITMYAKFDSMEDSLKVFEELRDKEIISWNALISGYVQNKLYHKALETFSLATLESQPNQFTFGSILSAMGASETISMRQGQRCHSHLVKFGLNMDPVVSSALLNMYAKRGNIGEARRVFGEIPERTQVSWTAIISAYSRHGDYDSVMSLFKEMEREEVEPDSITFLSVLTACGRKGMVNMARRVFEHMIKNYMIQPSSEHYSCMVDMLGRAGKLEEAEDLVGQIPKGRRLSALQSLLAGCSIHKNVEMGKRVTDALAKEEPTGSGSGSCVLMSNLYAENGEWEKVARIRKGMRERGVKKEIGFSWVDVDGSLYLHGFSSGDMSHPQSKEILTMAEGLGYEMKFLNREEERIYSIEM